jgi:DNA-binding transcriptional regulator YhcF (GntR family)
LHTTKLAGLRDTKQVAELRDWIHVDPAAAQPLFDQLRTQIIGGIRDDRLPPGTRLPTVRELATQLGLAVNTVARAYRELEAAGILETRGRFGTFVARRDPADAAMAAAAHSYVATARSLGISKADALHYVESAFG